MTFTAYQIITPLIAFLAITYAWNLVFRHKKTVWEGALWTVFWGAVGAIAIFPAAIDYLKVVTGIQKRENAVMVTFLGVLSFIVFYLIMRVEELEQRQTRLVRKIALRDAEGTDGKKGRE
ncbi:DUF2304 domain-containing protein [Candidatus Peregrinibacteria bacterium]|nr:DUF2304 domain-containing protein [Candidatus Peregrinibacteria bacterium]